MFCYISVSCIWRFVNYSFHKSFRKIFRWDPFLKNCLHYITVLSQTFWLSRKTNGLGRRSANRQFPPNVKFLHRSSVSLDKLPTFRKKWFAKNIKKNPQWAIWPTGDFFLTPHPKPLLRASFCANKKFQAYYGKTAVFRSDVESREKKYCSY